MRMPCNTYIPTYQTMALNQPNVGGQDHGRSLICRLQHPIPACRAASPASPDFAFGNAHDSGVKLVANMKPARKGLPEREHGLVRCLLYVQSSAPMSVIQRLTMQCDPRRRRFHRHTCMR